MGGAADSAHEYLLKQHLLTGKHDLAELQMCKRSPTSTSSMIDK